MIIPVGKIKHQEKQSQLRNGNILNSSLFEKIAITGMGEIDNISSESAPPVDENLSRAVGESSNPKMNLSNLNSKQTTNANPNPNPNKSPNKSPNNELTPYDPYTGEPNDTLVTDFGEVARLIEHFVKQNFRGEYKVLSLNQGKDGQFTLTFGPVNKGPVITKK